MKKLHDFSLEETGEEWLREGYKVVAMRRNVMFRMLLESVRLLLFGNAGGAALIIGFMSTTAGENEGAFHWLALATVLVFGLGTLTSALSMILVTLVSIKEAHGAETALKRFADGDDDRFQVMFNIEGQTWRLADWSTLTGIVSAATFILGGLAGVALLVVFF
ncbi:MAG: hypothetical protein OXU19_07315 [bacterium]|nr:hypothetical protein [bacterium]MDE0239071.1 hypothetical protein [bacterium]